MTRSYTKEELEAAIPHIRASLDALVTCWDELRIVERMFDVEISTDALQGYTFDWDADSPKNPEITIEDVKQILAFPELGEETHA